MAWRLADGRGGQGHFPLLIGRSAGQHGRDAHATADAEASGGKMGAFVEAQADWRLAFLAVLVYIYGMPKNAPGPQKSIEQIVEEVGSYPVEAYEFVQMGLQFTVQKIHGAVKKPQPAHHVTGRDLSAGLREFALMQWGLMARAVLRRWNITRTEDFGRIVFALVRNGWLSKTDEDTLDDFKNIFDFETAFEDGYRIECKS